MNSISKVIIASLIFLLTFNSCSEDYDDILHYRSINEFVWKAMNQYYLWQEEVADLNDTKASKKETFDNFLNSFESPKSLFDHLTFDVTNRDRFSVLFDNYETLEGILQGNTKNNGVDYELKKINGSDTNLFGWVRYILPNSDASTKNIQRGTIFYAVNGVSLTIENYKALLANETYTLNLADYDNGNIVPNGQSVTLTKYDYSENPVYIKNVIVNGNKRIGYLMYNGFYSNFSNELNAAFAYFQNQNITHLILDLRYNSGGSVTVATELASMITGQFSGQVFAKQIWNSKITNYYSSNPNALINKFTNSLSNGSSINSLQLSKLYVITSNATASASELVINGLTPYINVVKIGQVTYGKNVGSITLYDSPTFTKSNVNPTHKYALQPIVLKIVNKDNFGNYQNGILPNVPQLENLSDLGELGTITDPLLSTTLNHIQYNGRNIQSSNIVEHQFFKDTKTITSVERGMFLE